MAAVIGNRNISLGVMGGTLITAACYGGGDVFGCSPYDFATTRYLKATYGAYWQAIKQFGWDNPSLVPFVNEDNDLIVSLVEVGKERWLHGNGSSYFKTGLLLATNTKSRLRFRYNSVSSNTSPIGARGKNFEHIHYNSSFYYEYNSSWNSTGVSAVAHTIYDIETDLTNGSQSMKINGEIKKTTATTGVYTTNLDTYILASNNGSSVFGICNADFSVCELMESNGVWHYFYPFKRNGQMELLDIVTGTLATRVGTFTELIE